MLRKLLELGSVRADQGREETKLRAAMMLSKVFLQHLAPLSSLPTFPALWLSILDLVGQFCATASTDLLADALPESLKNMLLVMDTTGDRGLFFTEAGQPTPLWGVTWGKIDTFMPGLREELFPDWEKRAQVSLETMEVPLVAANNSSVDTTNNDGTAAAEPTEEPATETQHAPDTKEAPITSMMEAVSLAAEPSPAISTASILPPPVPLAGHFPRVISQQVRAQSNSSLPDPGCPPPVSPQEPPTRPATAFSLPTSPAHSAAASAVFAPITPSPSTPTVPLAAPRPVLATPLPAAPVAGVPGVRPVSAVTQLGPGDAATPTAFTNPLLAPAPPPVISNLPQFVASPQPPPAPATHPIEEV